MIQSAKILVEELNSLDEHQKIEAKSGAGDAVLETICAFCNEPDMGGGTILLGVQHDEDSLFSYYSVSGIDDPDKISADIASQCSSVFNTPVRPTIRAEKVDGRIILLIEVPEVSSAEKPIFFKKSGLPRGAY